MTRTILLTIALLSFVAAASTSGVVLVNEAMVNEPSDTVSLEWIELYNDGGLINLSFVSLITPIDTLGFVGLGSFAGGRYLVVCRDSSLFKNRWRTDTLPFPPKLIQRSFSLPNSSGSITLSLAGNFESELVWSSASNDGVSLERLHAGNSVPQPSVDPLGSTPGRMNSIAQLPSDLALLLPQVETFPQGTRITFRINNPGLSLVTNASLSVYLRPTSLNSTDSLIKTLMIPPTDTGFTTALTMTLALPSYYAPLRAELSVDDILSNNQQLLVAPGELYPPVIINEFIANPKAPLTTEWIELFNRSDTVIDLSTWLIGDSLGTAVIGPASLPISPGEYILLANKIADFSAFYPNVTSSIVRPSTWKILNNNGDLVRLIDGLGFEADRFSYSIVFDSNYSWARTTTAEQTVAWGQSSETGGTPGEENRVSLRPTGNRTEISFYPRVFSPDGDGVDDETIISVKAARADDYTLKIYDSEGREVRVFIDHEPNLLFPSEFVWNGRDDNGRPLPIGIYIVYFEAGGVESIKKTLVIAR